MMSSVLSNVSQAYNSVDIFILVFLFKDVKGDENVITEWLYKKGGIRFLRESVDVMIPEFGKEAGAFLVEDDCIDGVYRAIAEGMTRPL